MSVSRVSLGWSIPVSVPEGTVVEKVLRVALPILFVTTIMLSSARRGEELVVFMLMATTATVVMISSLFENTKEIIVYRDPWPSSNRLYGPGWIWESDPFFRRMDPRFPDRRTPVNSQGPLDPNRHVPIGRDK